MRPQIRPLPDLARSCRGWPQGFPNRPRARWYTESGGWGGGLERGGRLAGTFSAFVIAPGWMFRGGDPLLLTANGEFVVKSLVLITATWF